MESKLPIAVIAGQRTAYIASSESRCRWRFTIAVLFLQNEQEVHPTEHLLQVAFAAQEYYNLTDLIPSAVRGVAFLSLTGHYL